MLLPDVNVWLALTFDSHVHHPAAKTWFDGLADEVCFFCRLTQQDSGGDPWIGGDERSGDAFAAYREAFQTALLDWQDP
jgi:hypothetical protein